MALFEYTASDRSGALQKGQIEARDKTEAGQKLARDGLFLLELKTCASPLKATPSPKQPAPKPTPSPTQTHDPPQVLKPVRGWTGADRALFLRQMHVMFSAGIPLHRVGEVLAQSRPATGLLKSRLEGIPSDLERGRPLSRALQRSTLFDSVVVAAVRLGEESGRLEQILRGLADHEERALRLQRGLLSRLSYPLVVMVAMTLGLVVMGHVMGRVMISLPNLEEQLGPLTRLLLNVFTHGAFLPGLALGLASLVWTGAKAWRRPAFRRPAETVAISLPFLGPLVRRMEASSVTNYLALLIASGLPLDRGLALCTEAVRTEAFRQALRDGREALREGSDLTETFRRAALFPEDVVALVTAGELSGSLETSLRTAAAYCSEQVERSLETALALLEPLMVGLLGITIGLILLVTFVPVINSLNSL